MCPFALLFAAFCLVVDGLLPCRLPSFALQIAVSSQKNVRNQCHNVTVRRNPLAFTALCVTSSRRLMSPPSRFVLRRDIGDSAATVTVTA